MKRVSISILGFSVCFLAHSALQQRRNVDLNPDYLHQIISGMKEVGSCKIKVTSFDTGADQGVRIDLEKGSKSESFYLPQGKTFFYTSESTAFSLPEDRPEMIHAVLETDYMAPGWSVHAMKSQVVFYYDFEKQEVIGARFYRSINKNFYSSSEKKAEVFCGDTGSELAAPVISLNSRESGIFEFAELAPLLKNSLGDCDIENFPGAEKGSVVMRFSKAGKLPVEVIARPLSWIKRGDARGAYVHSRARSFKNLQIAAAQVWDSHEQNGELEFRSLTFYYDYNSQKIIGARANSYLSGKGTQDISNQRYMSCGNVGML